MGVEIRSINSVVNTGTITIPATTQVGDLIIFFANNFNAVVGKPSDFTTIDNSGPTGGNAHYSTLCYKIATSGDSGLTKAQFTAQNATYSTVTCLVLYGHDANAPINVWTAGVSTTSSVTVPAVTSTAETRQFYFAGIMHSSSSTVPSIVPSAGSAVGLTQQVAPAPSNYLQSKTWSRLPQQEAGSLTSRTFNNTQPGGFIAYNVAIKDGVEPPTATNLAPNNVGVPVGATKTFTWTYNQGEAAQPQDAFQIQYRAVGATTWTTDVSFISANAFRSYPANTFTDGVEYEWQVRVSDAVAGYGAWSPSAYFTGGANVWTYGPEVTAKTFLWPLDDPVSSSLTSIVGKYAAGPGILMAGNPPVVSRTGFTQNLAGPLTGMKALAFNSNNNNLVNFGNDSSVQLTKGTIEVWFRLATPGASYMGLMRKEYAYGLYLFDGKVIVYDWSAGQGIKNTDGLVYADNQWHHVAFTFDSGVVNGSQVYIDGSPKGAAFTYTILNQSQPLTLSRGIASGEQPGQEFTGVMSQAILHDYLLTPAEIATRTTQPFSLKIPAQSVTGEYQVQVRTADAIGFGPWSSSDTFLVKILSNVYQRVGGAWVAQKRLRRVSGAWVEQAITKIFP